MWTLPLSLCTKESQEDELCDHEVAESPINRFSSESCSVSRDTSRANTPGDDSQIPSPWEGNNVSVPEETSSSSFKRFVGL